MTMKDAKFCIVPECHSSNKDIKSALRHQKVWFPVPEDEKQRLNWMLAMGRDNFPNEKVYVCGDHFDENDMYGYEVYQQCEGQVKLKEDVVPHIFKCQEIAANKKTALELDKFKRRLIRAVARLLVLEKKPETEVWAELKKETSCDCQLLWSRMRALTVKKLQRLFMADDRTELIPKAARMSLTDWLLFDLVLVHQKIDLIGQENPLRDTTDDPKPLKDLFEMVKMFNIEGKEGDKLAEAWSSATLYYNNKGHQCSPMLLQRRWYQLKEATRNQFYNFWFSYRGAAKRLPLAEPHMPSQLQASIARRYKQLVTHTFHDWETLIEKRLVTLPEEFEAKMMERAITLPIRNIPDDNAPDLVVIEPVIETIDLRLDSDNETEDDEADNSSPPTEVKIKEEPVEMDIDIDEHQLEPHKKSTYDEVLESTLKEHDDLEKVDEEDDLVTEENEISLAIQSTLRTQESVLPQITSVSGNVSDIGSINYDDSNSARDVDDTSFLGKVDENSVLGNVDDAIVHGIPEEDIAISKVDNISVRGNVDDTIVNTDDTTHSNGGETNDVNEVTMNEDTTKPSTSIDPYDNRLVLDDDVVVDDDVILDDIPDSGNVPKNDNIESNNDKILVEIKPEIVEHSFIEPLKKYGKGEESISVDSINKTPEIDVKPNVTSFSFGDVSVDFNFVGEGIEFIDDGIAYVDEDSVADNVKIEIKTEVDDEVEEQNDVTPKIDAKLLMVPIIYTTRLDDMGLFNTQPFDHVTDKKVIDIITLKSKPKKELPADLQSSSEDEEEGEEDTISDTQKVKLSSYMLQKPRSRSYNPIQLCKNPDFNTRLKRLTVGFFSWPRNRGLLKSCKPLTIDLSKTFESKLVDGTLYLEPNDHEVKIEKIEDSESCQSVSVVPSAMPVQSLIDNSKIGDILPVTRTEPISVKPPDELSSTSERSKVINLPDISEIRRINQKLLTAEVTPIQVQNNTPQVPVSIVSTSSTSTVLTQKPLSFTQRDLQICPPKVVDITDDSPVKNTVVNPASTVSNRYPSVYTNTRSVQSTSQNDQIISKSGRTLKMVNGKILWSHKHAGMPWKPRQIRPDIPWLTKNQETTNLTKNVDETLLTLDTLNKMLFILSYDKDDTKDLPKPKPKKKKKASPRQNYRHEETCEQVVCENAEKPMDETAKCCRPKINIKSANNYPKGETNTTVDGPKQNDTSKKEINYCCWARQRMLQKLFSRKRIPEHKCPYPVCTCCCRILLKQYTANERHLRNLEEKGDSAKPSKDGVESKDDAKDNSENMNDTSTAKPDGNSEIPIIHIEIPVSQLDADNIDVGEPAVRLEIPVQTPSVAQNPVIANETPVIDVETSNNESVTNENELINLDDFNSEDGTIPALGSEVSITTSIKTPRGAVCSQPTFRVTAGNKSGKTTDPFKQRRRSSNRGRGANQPIMGPFRMVLDEPSVNPAPITTQSSLTQVLAAKKATMAKPIKTTVPQNYKEFTAPKNFKEKMIFLNCKQIAEKPTDNPIFLGKNKILLTTVKFPPNLKQFEDVKQNLKPLCLPEGVQLICLPSGLVTYTIDPDAKLNATQLASMPAILAAVQKKINASFNASQQNTVPTVDITDNEVVSLTDEDDDDTPEVIENTGENTKNRDTEVQKTDVDPKMSCTETEVNSVNLNNGNKPSDSTDTSTENNQNVIADLNSSKEIQVTVLEMGTEVPSTSTVQNEPETSTQSTNIDVNENNSNDAASGNKSKNILSDLMEMSGIFDEDVTPTPEETFPQEQQVQIPTEPAVELAQVSIQPLLEQEQLPAQPLMEQVQEPVVEQVLEPALERAPFKKPSRHELAKPGQDKPISVNNIPPVVNSPIGELSPITSLYELKYACLNNGIFFKLDFDTGFLVPINVCMKQHSKSNPTLPKNVEPKAVIDLTDDDETVKIPSSPTTPSKQNTKSLLICNQVPTGSAGHVDTGRVKPLKLFKSVHPGILSKTSGKQAISPEKEDKQSATNTNLDLNRQRHNRKQYLKKKFKKNVKDFNNSKGENTVIDTNITEDLPTAGAHLGGAQEKNNMTQPTLRKLLASDAITVKSDSTIINKYLRKMKPMTSLLADNNADKPPITIPAEKQKATNIVPEECSDSDDEPLAKKVKRKRENEAAPVVVNEEDVQMLEDTANDVAGDVETVDNVVTGGGVETADDVETDDIETANHVQTAEGSNTADVTMCDGESMQPGTQYELFMDQSDLEDGEDEHCILGV